jgi:hypothetical protein
MHAVAIENTSERVECEREGLMGKRWGVMQGRQRDRKQVCVPVRQTDDGQTGRQKGEPADRERRIRKTERLKTEHER